MTSHSSFGETISFMFLKLVGSDPISILFKHCKYVQAMGVQAWKEF